MGLGYSVVHTAIMLSVHVNVVGSLCDHCG